MGDKMNLLDIVQRPSKPIPWAEGENIPWNEPAFSESMLTEHLSQSHDLASRRAERIKEHVQWIHDDLLGRRPTKILDLGCGPGLYSSSLARLGHDCVGIDYSPASIRHAKDQAAQEGLRCKYVQQDMRAAEFGRGFGLVMLIYGEFNVFRRSDVQRILGRARAALADGGHLLIEAHTLEAIERIGSQGRSWYSAEAGLFSDRPHTCLQEGFWEPAGRMATIRFLIIDAASAGVTRHAVSYQGYDDAEYRSLLAEAGFEVIDVLPSLTGCDDESPADLIAIVARAGT